jgi:hypothetical protein
MLTKKKNTQSMLSKAALQIDDLAPFPKRGEVVAHEGLSVLEVSEEAELSSLLLDKRFMAFILLRLSKTEALILPEHSKKLVSALVKAGYTPKVVS